MKNQEIRNAIRSAGVRQWQVAEAMGLREDTLSRKLRHELYSLNSCSQKSA